VTPAPHSTLSQKNAPGEGLAPGLPEVAPGQRLAPDTPSQFRYRNSPWPHIEIKKNSIEGRDAVIPRLLHQIPSEL
jgi:hypothetical protein